MVLKQQQFTFLPLLIGKVTAMNKITYKGDKAVTALIETLLTTDGIETYGMQGKLSGDYKHEGVGQWLCLAVLSNNEARIIGGYSIELTENNPDLQKTMHDRIWNGFKKIILSQ